MGVKQIIGEILDYVRAMALDILSRKVMGKDVERKEDERDGEWA
jgi:uncharacterized protein YfeS